MPSHSHLHHGNNVPTRKITQVDMVLQWLGLESPFRKKTWWDSNEQTRISEYNRNIDHVLASHRGPGVKEFMLQFHGPYTTESYNRLDRWLQIAITPVLEDLTLSLLPGKKKCEFPWSLLYYRSRNTIQYLSLCNCVLRPSINIGLRCLTQLELYEVHITGDELGRLISGSFTLENLKIAHCCDIIRFEIPCQLQRLSFLEACYAIDKLASNVPNLKTLTLYCWNEIVNAPMVPSKFLHLKVLSIYIRNWTMGKEYDFLSLVSILDASPSLETFVLSVSVESKYELIVGDPSTLRQMPEHHHDRLKDVKIKGFCPQKSLIELTCHILDSAASLKCLTLDTIHINYRCSGNKSDKCHALNEADIKTAPKSVEAIKAYIEGKVSSTVQLDILESCSRCHAS